MGIMSAALYNPTILRLATSIPHHSRLAAPQASISKRSPICGSRVTVDVMIDAEGRVTALGQEVRACALGQASASLMGAHAIGRTAAELAEARDRLAAFLAGEAESPGDWPGIEIFLPARDYAARHPSIRLAFEAVAEAAAQAAHEPVAAASAQ
jgi:NifU-like protein involved in Fe-S cluster formation